jgi:outer membrane protein OmpA-like peptidoglycan-associated protein
MTPSGLLKIAFVAILSVIGLAVCGAASAQSKVEGIIKARNGDTMVLQSAGSPNLTVLLTDSTKVGQVQGVFQARRKEMSMAALIPGLQVKVEGSYDDKNQLVASSVSFKGNDLEDAEKINAGMHESKVLAQQQQAELEKQNAELQAQNAALEKQQTQLTEHQAKIAANQKAIDAAVARFGQLDDYYIFDEVTVYFANGKVNVDPKYNEPLLALAKKAESIEGYMIEVKGYASAVGSVTLNQKLSEDRASNVTNILLQKGNIPLTRMLAPGAMGESHQVGTDNTAEGQAENRRVVVRVLQNKAIAGI